MVEELLELLVGVVDAQLLEAVHLEDLEPGNIQDTNKTGSLPLGSIQRAVDPRHDPLEQPLICGLGNGFDGELNLFLGLRLGDIIPANLDSRLEERLGQVSDLNA